MTKSRFAAVFDLMSVDADVSEPAVIGIEVTEQELEEIAELRRAALEIAAPEIRSYTRS